MTTLNDLPDLVLDLIASHVHDADRWLLAFVSTGFRRSISKTNQTTTTKNIRVRDKHINRAVKGGCIATARFLIDRPSCAWTNALPIASALGDTAMVYLVLESNWFQRKCIDFKTSLCLVAISNAVHHNHVKVAEIFCSKGLMKRQHVSFFDIGLFDHFYIDCLLNASTFSKSSSMLDWVISKYPRKALAILVDERYSYRFFKSACSDGSVEYLEHLCDLMTHPISKAVFKIVHKRNGNYPLSRDVAILKFLRERFGYTLDLEGVSEMRDNHAVLAYLLSLSSNQNPNPNPNAPLSRSIYIEKMLSVPVHKTPDCHAYLRSLGHRIDVDLNVSVKHNVIDNVISNDCLKHLMALRNDPAEWMLRIGQLGLSLLMRRPGMQASFAEFFRHMKDLFNFQIVDVGVHFGVDEDMFRKLMHMGGHCGLTTLLNVAGDPNCGIDWLTTIWESIDNANLKHGITYNQYILCSLNVDKLIYIMDTIGVPAERIRLSSQSDDWTVELSEFVIDRKIKTPRKLLKRIARCCHMDIAEFVIPQCSIEDLAEALTCGIKNDVHDLIKQTILERTHPMLKWSCSAMYFGW